MHKSKNTQGTYVCKYLYTVLCATIGAICSQGILIWGVYLCCRLLDTGSDLFRMPRKGKNNDQAHPPIHPTKPAKDLAGDDSKIYEFVTRRFLACCSDDARGYTSTVSLSITEEQFTATGKPHEMPKA